MLVRKSIGIKIRGDFMHVIIPKGTRYPCKNILEIDSNGVLYVVILEDSTGNMASTKIDLYEDEVDELEDDFDATSLNSEENDEFKSLYFVRKNFEDHVYKQKRVIEASNRLSDDHKIEALTIITAYLKWSESFPKQKSLYFTHQMEINDDLKEYLEICNA
ncbi:hypothetical protein WR25_23027 [Diploscapter pachys]|uniref:Uncharacterized protein n=1 Tax=Diploscapter pachys TaxID=2018661 RepID=A0A2A2KA78_9BILA|nr:hypothetical protein WR25_23027 [Diploscapter pachys]